MSFESQYNAQLTGESRPEAGRGLSSFDNIGGGVDGLASTLGSGASAQPVLSSNSGAFAPSSSSSLASQSPMVNTSATSGTSGSGASSGLSNTSGLSSNNPFATDSTESTGSSSLNSSSTATSRDPSLAQFTSEKLAQASSALGQASEKVAPSNTGSSSIDIGGAQTSSTGGATPGGVVKSDDHVESLTAAIGGIILNAPLAAAELIAGKTKQGVAVVQQQANERGLNDIAAQVQGHMNNASGVAQDKIQQARGPNAAPIGESISAYANSAVQQASALASSVSQQAQGLVSRASTSDSNPLTTSDGTPTTQNLPSGQGIASTLQGYATSAAQSVSGAAASVAQSAHTLTDRVGLTSPVAQDTTTAVHPEQRHFATAESDAPRAVLADSETPVNTSRSEVPSAQGASLSSADSYSSPQAASSLQPDSIAQPKAAHYGEGKIAEAPLSS